MSCFLKSTQRLAIVILVITLCALCIVQAVCPSADDIKPCTCDDQGLQCLKLNDYGLERVFKAPAERKAIKRVWIMNTKLTQLKTKAFGDYIIREFYLDLNFIRKVESGAFGEATKIIQNLSLTRNKLESFPFEDLQQMKKLKQLGLGHNKLTVIASRAFPSSDTLESVDLSHNSIHTIQPYAFAELYEVSLIDLSRNSLREIEAHSLLVKSSSRHLAISLRGNKITKIAIDAFGNHHPHTLDLSHNQLTYLDEYTFAPLLMNNTLINVEENRFHCKGCDLYKWLLELDAKYLENLDNFVCMGGVKLEDLTLHMLGC